MRRYYALAIAALVAFAAPLTAQGKGPKKYAVTNDRALVVTREVLVKQGYEVVRVENSGRDYVVWYPPSDGLPSSPAGPSPCHVPGCPDDTRRRSRGRCSPPVPPRSPASPALPL